MWSSPPSCCIADAGERQVRPAQGFHRPHHEDPRLQALLIASRSARSSKAPRDSAPRWRWPPPCWWAWDSCRSTPRHLPAGEYRGVAFGAIGIPVATLRSPPACRSTVSARRWPHLHARLSVLSAYLILVMYGRKGLRGVLPAWRFAASPTPSRSCWFRIPFWRRSPVLAGIAALSRCVRFACGSRAIAGRAGVAQGRQPGGDSARRAGIPPSRSRTPGRHNALLVVCCPVGYKPLQAQFNR